MISEVSDMITELKDADTDGKDAKNAFKVARDIIQDSAEEVGKESVKDTISKVAKKATQTEDVNQAKKNNGVVVKVDEVIDTANTVTQIGGDTVITSVKMKKGEEVTEIDGSDIAVNSNSEVEKENNEIRIADKDKTRSTISKVNLKKVTDIELEQAPVLEKAVVQKVELNHVDAHVEKSVIEKVRLEKIELKKVEKKKRDVREKRVRRIGSHKSSRSSVTSVTSVTSVDSSDYGGDEREDRFHEALTDAYIEVSCYWTSPVFDRLRC